LLDQASQEVVPCLPRFRQLFQDPRTALATAHKLFSSLRPYSLRKQKKGGYDDSPRRSCRPPSYSLHSWLPQHLLRKRINGKPSSACQPTLGDQLRGARDSFRGRHSLEEWSRLRTTTNLSSGLQGGGGLGEAWADFSKERRRPLREQGIQLGGLDSRGQCDLPPITLTAIMRVPAGWLSPSEFAARREPEATRAPQTPPAAASPRTCAVAPRCTPFCVSR